jgi:hypothetical protein
MAYKVRFRFQGGVLLFRVVENATSLQAIMMRTDGHHFRETAGATLTFLNNVDSAGFKVIAGRKPSPDGIRRGLLCWRADVIPAGKKWPTSRGK